MIAAGPSQVRASGRGLRRRSSSAPRAPRWMVYGFCPLTGPWRQIVHAASAAGALVKYCAEHEMSPEACHVRPG
jgi:hypothetical protein